MIIVSPTLRHLSSAFLWISLLVVSGIFGEGWAPDSYGAPTPPRTLNGHQGEIFGLAFDPSGQIIASGSGDQSIRLWDVETGRLQTVLKGHTAAVRTLAFSPKGNFLASGGSDKTTRIWDVQTGKETVSFTSVFGNIRAVAFSPDGEILASTGRCRRPLVQNGGTVLRK